MMSNILKQILLCVAFAVVYSAPVVDRYDAVDVIFVLDGSGSIKAPNFEIVKDWVNQVVSEVDLEKVNVGVIQYSSDNSSTTEVTLGRQVSYNSFSNAVENITYKTGYTFTAQALNHALEDFKRYGRKNACKMAVILTDGKSTDPEDLPTASEALRNAGIKSIAVGVHKADYSELTTIATGDVNNTDGVVMLNQFKSISTVANSISNSVTRCDQVVVGMADVMFVLDGSGSIGVDNFEKVKEWVKIVTESLPIDDGRVNVGVIQYAHSYSNIPISFQKNMRTEIELSTQTSFQSFSEKVDKISLIGHGTSTGYALGKLLFDLEKYGRDGVCKFAIVLTDGKANDPEYITSNVQILEEQHVIRLVVGVGNTNQQELEEIASATEDGEEAIITLKSFDEILDTISFFTKNFLCGGNHLVGKIHQ